MSEAVLPETVAPEPVLLGRSPAALTVARLLRSPKGWFGAAVVAAFVLIALLAPLIAPMDPLAQHAGQELLPPGGEFLLGTDNLGRDLFSRLVFGSRISLLVGMVAVALGAGVGVLTGLVAGYFGATIDTLIMRFYDGLMAFPTILLGIAVVTALGPGLLNVAYAIGLAQIPHFARITRACVLVERQRDYVVASRSLGASDLRLMMRHVLPNCLSPLLVQLTLTMTFAILAEASLSFLGLGTQPPTASWGAMLSESRSYLDEGPWMAVCPGLTLAVLLLGMNFLQDALRDALDPRRAGWG
jgi:peptide/nickel transport system permease protein